MKPSRFTEEHIIGILREQEAGKEKSTLTNSDPNFFARRFLRASMPSVRRRLVQRGDRDDDAQPRIGAFLVSLGLHPLDHLTRLRDGVVTVSLNPQVSRAGEFRLSA